MIQNIAFGHMLDVVNYTKVILDRIDNKDIDIDACIISSYWHDVGRKYQNKGHEQLSADMLTEEMKNLGYDDELILDCYNAIVFHRWDMTPKTIEGEIIRDADKLGFIGKNRWNDCLKNNKKLDYIELLPTLRDELLHLEIAKKIYDEEIENFKRTYNINF